MSVRDVIKKSVMEGFSQTDITTTQIIITLVITMILAIYIFFIYKLETRSVFYSKEFNITVAVVSVVTASIVLAMQSNIVVSLGMVGALSIVRFRSAIKNPLDLLYLFWSISVGIVCGAGMYEIAVITSIIVTLAIVLLDFIPVNHPPYLLIIHAKNQGIEEKLQPVLKEYAKNCQVKSRNISKNQLSIIIELRTKEEQKLVAVCSKLEGVANVSLMSHDGEVRG